MSANGKVDHEEYAQSAAVARELRETVADQLHDLVIERESLGSKQELVDRVQMVGEVSRRVTEAHGRELQARELGLPVGPPIRDQRDATRLLRQSVMSLGEACAALVVSMDFEARRSETEDRPRRRRRGDDEDF